MDDSRTVYSTRHGSICAACGKPKKRCICRASPRAPRGDGSVRVRRELRRGKTLTVILGLSLPSDERKALASELKRQLGTGGSAKRGAIEIQGDHREALIAALLARGFRVERAGG